MPFSFSWCAGGGVVDIEPEGGVARDGEEGGDEVGIEPGAAAGGGHVYRRVCALRHVEDVDVLGEVHDAGEQGDLLALQTVGLAAAVP